MRWTMPNSGDIKIKRKFALLPIEIDKEVRWLEWVTIQYKFSDGEIQFDPNTHLPHRSYGWSIEKFIDE